MIEAGLGNLRIKTYYLRALLAAAKQRETIAGGISGDILRENNPLPPSNSCVYEAGSNEKSQGEQRNCIT